MPNSCANIVSSKKSVLEVLRRCSSSGASSSGKATDNVGMATRAACISSMLRRLREIWIVRTRHLSGIHYPEQFSEAPWSENFSTKAPALGELGLKSGCVGRPRRSWERRATKPQRPPEKGQGLGSYYM